MDHRPKNDYSYVQHFKGIFLINKTERVYTAVQTGFLRKIGVKYCSENFKAIFFKYLTKPFVSTLQ